MTSAAQHLGEAESVESAGAYEGLRLSLVILNWNTPHLVQELLSSLPAPRPPQVQIVVVDNGSARPFRPQSSPTEVDVYLALPENIGYAGGMNEGIKLATGDWVLLCNSDVRLSIGFLEVFRDLAQSVLTSGGRVGIVGGIFLKSGADVRRPASAIRQGLVDSAGGALTPSLRMRPLRASELTMEGYVTCLSGACFGISRPCLEELRGPDGPFDSTYGSYGEDKDLWLRAIRSGWQMLYSGNLVAAHAGSASTGGAVSLMGKPAWIQSLALRNRIRNYARHLSASEIVLLMPYILVGHLAQAARFALRGEFGLAGITGRALCVDWWRGWSVTTARATPPIGKPRGTRTLRRLLAKERIWTGPLQ